MSKTAMEADEIVQNLMGWLKAHNCSRRWFMNVMSASGECGVLGISNKLKKQLDEKIKMLKTESIDPRDLENGVWFNFIRVGTGWEVPDTVDILMEKVEVPGMGFMERKKRAPVTDAQAQAALQACPDLSSYLTVLSYAQIKLMTETGSDPEAVDKVFAIGQPVEAVRRPVAPPVASKPTQAPEQPPKAQAAPEATRDPLPAWAGLPTPDSKVLSEIEILRAKLKAAEETAAASLKQQIPVEPKSETSSAPSTLQTDGNGQPTAIDFLKKYRINPDADQ